MAHRTFGLPISRRYGVALLIIILALLSGCGANGTIDGDTPGTFNHYVVYPFSELIQHLADWFGGNYGISIIVMTLLVRIVLMPLMIRQQTGQMAMREKMKAMQPELAQLKEKYQSKKDPESARKQQQETMQLYAKYGVNPLAMGCLPLIIQLPILTGLYYAIRMTPELKEHSFLWFKLGATDPIMPLVAAAVYLVQSIIMQRMSGSSAESGPQKQLAGLVYLSPIMMGLFSFSAPAALPLYWAVGGVFMIGQSYLAHWLYARRKAKGNGIVPIADVKSANN
ncbi:membrane protein insertase MisCA [Paenibacillus sp. CCS19]|uniref:membrane protein insertase YidC n=1 Tax=Paenibacillus sp. CCS19 TaxID=3158387 RepID=UPI00256BF55E|nr:membrane protein insertase YidC [Paenibacillus cellulosilyticus]GMK41606.1 membrane protein insertase MisCA [Paenibacillus cellulosilyticus]